ncbi:MAG: chemotaxis response regulator protein-glutamate methylesterase [Candidatus Hinthialibacter antarcticus]|nr:chemotaxis response regulator protein-glutamate methylesterase [Candidatus Hinthialibacter antarcticus]
MNSKIRVLVVDDSALIRKMLSDLLNQNPEIEVVGSAQDGAFVMRKIEQLKPDVITLDVEMRTKGGLEVLPEIVREHHIPVIMVSAHTEQGAHSTLKALELGAVDFVTKPQAGLGVNLEEIVDALCQKIIAVGRSRARTPQRTLTALHKPTASRPVLQRPIIPASCGKVDLIAVGASTGGPEALRELLVNLPGNLPGILIVQHMPAGFTKAFANRLDGLCAMHVKEAEEGDPVSKGTALIAPGSHHMELVRSGSGYRVRLLDTDPVNRHRPAVDVLFNSVARLVGKRCVAIQMTGMGGDGSRGLLNIFETGAMTIAQDQDSCVVFGMPKEAIKLGAATHILPLQQIAPFVTKSLGVERQMQMAASN